MKVYVLNRWWGDRLPSVMVVVCALLLALPLPPAGNRAFSGSGSLSGSGDRPRPSEEELHCPAHKSVRRIRREFVEGSLASPAPVLQANAVPRRPRTGLSSPSLVPNRRGSTCRHDCRDGLGAPFLC